MPIQILNPERCILIAISYALLCIVLVHICGYLFPQWQIDPHTFLENLQLLTSSIICNHIGFTKAELVKCLMAGGVKKYKEECIDAHFNLDNEFHRQPIARVLLFGFSIMLNLFGIVIIICSVYYYAEVWQEKLNQLAFSCGLLVPWLITCGVAINKSLDSETPEKDIWTSKKIIDMGMRLMPILAFAFIFISVVIHAMFETFGVESQSIKLVFVFPVYFLLLSVWAYFVYHVFKVAFLSGFSNRVEANMIAKWKRESLK